MKSGTEGRAKSEHRPNELLEHAILSSRNVLTGTFKEAMPYRRRLLFVLTLVSAPFCRAATISSLVPRFAYVANGQDNTISAFAIERAQLRAVGYTYVGRNSNPHSVVVTPSQKFLYAAGTPGIYGYAIDAITGTLSAIPGSPFRRAHAASISITPSEHFLVVGGPGGIFSYSINPDSGVLALSASVTGETVTSVGTASQTSFVYVASTGLDKISGFAINEGSGIFTPVPNSPFTVQGGPQAIAIDPFGKFLYVANAGSANVSAFSITKTGTLIEVPGTPFAAGLNPVSAVLTRSGKFLYVGNSTDKTISQYEVNRTTGALLSVAQPFPTGASGPLGLAVNPKEPLLYVAVHDSDDVKVLGMTRSGVLFNESSIRSRGPATAIALASGGTAISYAPRFVYESNAISNNVWGYRVSSDTGALSELTNSPFSVGESPLSMVSDLRGRVIFTANSGDGSISGFTVNSQNGALTPVPGSPFQAGVHPGSIVVDTNAHYVYTIDADLNRISGFAISDGGSLRPVTGSPFANRGSGPEATTIDPRGRVLYVANAQSGTISIYQIDAQTGKLAYSGSIAASASPIALAINPDGNYLYALDRSSGTISSYAVNSVTGLLLRLPDAPAQSADSLNFISVSPSGKRVYAVGNGVVNGYTLFGNNGRLKPLSGSPFGSIGHGSSLTINLAERFMWISNSDANNVSGFDITKATGSLAPLSDPPFRAGTGPSSIMVVDALQ